MYYVNREQIDRRLQAIPEIVEVLQIVVDKWDKGLSLSFAQERALHLAIETVTDVGSFLIDGFIMRDASSYEDILEITHKENVFNNTIYNCLIELVKLRRPLVQDYYEWDRSSLHPLTKVLPTILNDFVTSVKDYLDRELGTS
ncbi:DUF86 domain-containing protein [Paenibacillus crassostreae]|uniref:DUF86 domain-containing protein n=1 Tax=Paenibacillus crassostreae TaxID=1763538 RepID=A0A167FYD9_9BACL|nr:HepT-like ribonuclease domain-containing protein [Paenibacillus crassostreae]AOZ93946.1 hypothetical protein LPB68_18310 [Paenibacillus crassostreae]OAB77022.1 hypothetical protein PNBC_06430 [Paenibacillus crassostreae]